VEELNPALATWRILTLGFAAIRVPELLQEELRKFQRVAERVA
jgi:hypothetical protein